MDNIDSLKDACTTLSLTYTRNNLDAILHDASQENISFLSFLTSVTTNEIQFRQQRASDKRIKEAGFPYPKSLDEFDLNFCQALTAKQLAQLRELTWIDGLYNMILAGPPGVGKTHLAIGLGYEACSVSSWCSEGSQGVWFIPVMLKEKIETGEKNPWISMQLNEMLTNFLSGE
ncbi:MAG: ATP-binding protein [Clostridia bacterium]|nr:ATP-binding protein [Clostridia bacterium]